MSQAQQIDVKKTSSTGLDNWMGTFQVIRCFEMPGDDQRCSNMLTVEKY